MGDEFLAESLIPQPFFSQPFRLPRMNAEEVASDQELPNGRIPAGHMAMRIRHLPKRSFSAILIDSVAMPGVIFE